MTVQALGGTGGLKIGADFCGGSIPAAQVWISQPSWENHRALFENAGFDVECLSVLRRGHPRPGLRRHDENAWHLPAGSIVVLHACCHNPTGVDLTPEQWGRSSSPSAAATWSRSSTSPIRASAMASISDAEPVRRFAATGGPLIRFEFVLEVVLALRGARRRAERCGGQQRRSCARIERS